MFAQSLDFYENNTLAFIKVLADTSMSSFKCSTLPLKVKLWWQHKTSEANIDQRGELLTYCVSLGLFHKVIISQREKKRKFWPKCDHAKKRNAYSDSYHVCNLYEIQHQTPSMKPYGEHNSCSLGMKKSCP